MTDAITPLNRIATASAWAGGIALLACALLISVDLLLRKLLGISLGGADEIAGYVLAIVSSWAFPLALLRRSHIRVDILYSRLSLKPRVALDLLALLGMAVFVATLLWHSGAVLWDSIRFQSVSTTPLQVPLWIPQTLWFAGYLFFAVTILVLAWVSLKQMRQQRLQAVSALLGIHSVEEEIQQEVQAPHATQSNRGAR